MTATSHGFGWAGPSEPISLLVVEDQELVRTALCSLIDSLEGFSVVAEAADGHAAVAAALEHLPDVVLMDVGLPGLSGIEATMAILEAWPEAKVLALSAVPNANVATHMLRIGAMGFLSKHCGPEELTSGLRAAVRGRRVLGSQLVDALAGRDLSPFMKPTPTAGQQLTPKEREVLDLVVQGLDNPSIAERLSVSKNTVEGHRTRMRRRVGVRTDVQLLRRVGFLGPYEERQSRRLLHGER